MVPLPHLWLPIVLAAVLVFITSSLIHMVVKWHNSDYRQLPDEAAVLAALRKDNPAPGQYMFPYCSDPKDFAKPDVRQRFLDNPKGLIYLKEPGLPGMGSQLGGWFIFNLLVSFCVAYVVSRTMPPSPHYLQVFRVAGTVAFLAYATGTAPASIWMGKPWRVTLKEMVDGLLYALVLAGTFGWLWPK